jgi:excisionase family DNA binding protein
MINVKDVARLLSVSEKKVYRLIAQNSVPYYKIGEEYQFNRVELLEWATMMGIKVSTETFIEDNSGQSSNSVFLDALKEGSINYDVSGTDRESVLRNVVKTFKVPVDFIPTSCLRFYLLGKRWDLPESVKGLQFLIYVILLSLTGQNLQSPFVS